MLTKFSDTKVSVRTIQYHFVGRGFAEFKALLGAKNSSNSLAVERQETAV